MRWKRREYSECIGKPSAMTAISTQFLKWPNSNGGLHVKNSEAAVYLECEFPSPSFHIHVNSAIGNGGVQIIEDILVTDGGYNFGLTDTILRGPLVKRIRRT